VSVFVSRAYNLPNRDVYPLSSKVSDPYVEFRVGQNFRFKTDYIRDSLNPVWNQELLLGLLVSGTEMLISIYDADSGLEFADDMLVRVKIRVPFCSTFNASTETINCGKPFNCAADDSLWQMPTRQVCRETVSINMNTGTQCSDTID
jgi:Ca2+-dependent lipid-binding protein